MEGWIKVHRKLLDNPIITKDSDYLSVWIHLLLNATHKEYDTLFKGERITLQKGQLITGIISISKKLKINKDKVQRILKSFENDKQIKQQTSNRNRLISIVNWNEYQEFDKQNDKQMINKCETDDKQVITNKNVKNIKNNKNVITTIGDSCVNGLQEVISFYENNIGLITPYGIETLGDYEKELGKDIVIFAIKKAVDSNVRTIAYIKGTLNNWQNAGIKTLIQAEEESRNFRNRNITQEETREEKNKRKIRELEEAINANK